MTPSVLTRSLVARAALNVLAGAALVGAVAPAAAAAASPVPATTSLRQQVGVDWTGSKAGGDRTRFNVPGIGTGEVICRRDSAMVRISPNDRTAETSMWTALVQPKGGAESVAVRNARVYRFSTPTSDVPSGTGPSTHEGLNQENRIEDAGAGRAFGLISQRSSRRAPAQSTAPQTSFTLRWHWTGFRGPKQNARCLVTARFTTALPADAKIRRRQAGLLRRSPGPATNGFGLDWHGDADSAGRTESPAIQLPFLGSLQARCPSGHGAQPSLVLTPDDRSAPPRVKVTTFEGEGFEVGNTSVWPVDPVTGLIGPIPLPGNGLVRVDVSRGKRQSNVIVSSVLKTNDPVPAENFCEIAAQAISE